MAVEGVACFKPSALSVLPLSAEAAGKGEGMLIFVCFYSVEAAGGEKIFMPESCLT